MPTFIYIPSASSGSWAPDDLSDLVVWLDADDTAFANNDAVDAWTNKGSGGNTAQATSTKRPIFRTNLLNGKPGVDFDGTDDGLQISSLALDTYISVFVVAKMTTAKPLFIEHSSNTNTNDGFFLYGSISSNYSVRRTNLNAGSSTSSWFGSAAAQAALVIDSIASPGVIAKLWKNGTAESLSTDSGSDSTLSDSSVTDTLHICCRNQASVFSDGELHELIIYNAPVSTGDREKLEGYLAHKWGLTADLPTGHPYKNSAP